MARLLTHVRRFAGEVRRDWRRSPEQAVLEQFAQRAASEPRRTRGSIECDPYRIHYVDAMTAWPQWDDIFVRGVMRADMTTPSPRILDGGANIGLASLYFARRFPRAHITAFEPDPVLAETCRRNLAANDAASVEVIDAALWREDGPVPFRLEGTDSGSISAVSAGTDGVETPVTGVRLRRWLEDPVDLLKLDIEGAELDVLEDSHEALASVRCLVLDLHEFDPAHRRTGRVFELLADAGFCIDIAHHTPLGWNGRPADAPFPDAAPVWAMTVRAWRR
jgi:FkbM family methyltransferase